MRFRGEILKILFFIGWISFIQSCSKSNFASQETTTPLEAPSLNISYDCTIGNETTLENDSKTFFLKSSVPYGSTCQSENRICTKGFFSGSYQFTTCDIDAPLSCLHNGATIPDSQSITAYQFSSVPFGQSCTQEQRTCTNGLLSGSYVYNSCSVGVAASCLFNGMTVANGAGVTAFLASTVPFGSSCQAQLRTCTNGTLSGAYTFASCAVNAPASCLFNGVTIPHGATVSAYSIDNAPFWADCSDYVETRTCSNGVLSGSHQYSSCSE